MHQLFLYHLSTLLKILLLSHFRCQEPFESLTTSIQISVPYLESDNIFSEPIHNSDSIFPRLYQLKFYNEIILAPKPAFKETSYFPSLKTIWFTTISFPNTD